MDKAEPSSHRGWGGSKAFPEDAPVPQIARLLLAQSPGNPWGGPLPGATSCSSTQEVQKGRQVRRGSEGGAFSQKAPQSAKAPTGRRRRRRRRPCGLLLLGRSHLL